MDTLPSVLTEEQRGILQVEAEGLNAQAKSFLESADIPRAEAAFQKALVIRRVLYPVSDYPDGHTDLAISLANMGALLRAQGRLAESEQFLLEAVHSLTKLYPSEAYPTSSPLLGAALNNLAVVLLESGRPAEAEPYYRASLHINSGAFPPAEYPVGHPFLAQSLGNMAFVLHEQGKSTEAEPHYQQALSMWRGLYPSETHPAGHPELVRILINFACWHHDQGDHQRAEELLRDALTMNLRLYPEARFPAGHPQTARALSNLGMTLRSQGKLPEAELRLNEALAMRQRLYPKDRFPSGHPDVAQSLVCLASALADREKYREAYPVLRAGVEMNRQLYPKDRHPAGHPKLVRSLATLAHLHHVLGETAEAGVLLREALDLSVALMEDYAKSKQEGDALTFAATFPLLQSSCLSIGIESSGKAGVSYSVIWRVRSALSRMLEWRHVIFRSSTSSPLVRHVRDELAVLRRQRAELLLAPAPGDEAGRQCRDRQLDDQAIQICYLEQALRFGISRLEQTDRVTQPNVADLQTVLLPDEVFVDFLRYTHFNFDLTKPQAERESRDLCYTAFIVTKSDTFRIDLGLAAPIEAVVTDWRKAISKGLPDAEIAALLRSLVWDKLVPHLPQPCSVVYLAPDMALAGVPWAALPGSKPGTVLLEEHAILTVPHGQFLLGQLTTGQPRTEQSRMLLVGDVAYDDQPVGHTPSLPEEAVAARGGSVRWRALPGTAREATGIESLADMRNVEVASLSKNQASTAVVMAELPNVRIAHLATHGFFADASFRSAFQVDPQLFETRGSERVGAGALSPFVLSGLVFAGANQPGTPGRGILTAEAIVGLDLSCLGLAVLSACETGLGDVAGGEGVFGLQKAFHVAGCRNVVASLWKVEDDATAALMSMFYWHLLVDDLPAAESLRKAQLALYRNPRLVTNLPLFRTPQFEESPLSVGDDPPQEGGATAPTGIWAAFTFSGVDR